MAGASVIVPPPRDGPYSTPSTDGAVEDLGNFVPFSTSDAWTAHRFVLVVTTPGSRTDRPLRQATLVMHRRGVGTVEPTTNVDLVGRSSIEGSEARTVAVRLRLVPTCGAPACASFRDGSRNRSVIGPATSMSWASSAPDDRWKSPVTGAEQTSVPASHTR